MPFLTQRSTRRTTLAQSASIGGMTSIASVLAPSKAAPIAHMTNPKTPRSEPWRGVNFQIFGSAMPVVVHLAVADPKDAFLPRPRRRYCSGERPRDDREPRQYQAAKRAIVSPC
jgi:hypothetical protein